jgi:hypothetical protein
VATIGVIETKGEAMSLCVAKVIDIMVLCNNSYRSTINQHNYTNDTKGRREGGMMKSWVAIPITICQSSSLDLPSFRKAYHIWEFKSFKGSLK